MRVNPFEIICQRYSSGSLGPINHMIEPLEALHRDAPIYPVTFMVKHHETMPNTWLLVDRTQAPDLYAARRILHHRRNLIDRDSPREIAIIETAK